MTVYNAETALLLKPVLRSFYMCINIDMPRFLQNKEILASWISLFKMLIDSELPANLTSSTHNEELAIQRDAHPLWKNKKWAGRILTKFIQRYTNKKVAQGESMIDIAQWLIDTQCQPIM